MTQYKLTLTKTIDADEPIMDFCYDDTTGQLMAVENMPDELKRMFDIGYIDALNVLQDAEWSVEEVSTNLAHTIPDAPWLIGIAGCAGHGKDTIGAVLADYGYQRVAFADKVREAALAIDPLVFISEQYSSSVYVRLSRVVEVYTWQKAKCYPDIRRLLQRIGTEMGRNVLGEYVWIDALHSSLDRQQKYVITDVRFENEVEFIKENGGVVWFVVRPGYGDASDHVSEQLSPTVCDLVVVNDGAVDDLRGKVERIMSGMVQKKIDG